MSTAAQSNPRTGEPRTLIGWQGVRFTLPPEWNVTGFSTERGEGYLKVDSPDTMFVQVKWSSPGTPRARTLGDLLLAGWRRWRGQEAAAPKPPDLRGTLDRFLKETARRTRKSRAAFDYKVKPEVEEAGGERLAHHFSWKGAGQAQGKIWHCRSCGRVMVAQVVGQARDNVADVAAAMFGSMCDHSEDGWDVWALYDLVAAVPESFRLAAHKLMSGQLRLEFARRGERIRIERWGLANVARKRFTLKEWMEHATEAPAHRAPAREGAEIQGHEGVTARGRVRGPIALVRAVRDALPSLRPGTRYDAQVWECAESNKLYAVQVWRNVRTKGLLEEVVARCECH